MRRKRHERSSPEPGGHSDSTPSIDEGLAAIWRQVLQLDGDAAPDKTFIELGGDSMAATLCTAAIYESFAVECPAVVLLDEHGTLRHMQGFIARALAAKRSDA